MNAAAYITENWRKRDDAAIITETATWDYEALSAQISQIAQGLLNMGIHPTDRCLLLSENSAFSVAAYLAIISVGSVAVTLSERVTVEQAQSIREQVEPKALVASNLLSKSPAFKKIGTLPVYSESSVTQMAAPSGEGLRFADIKDPQKNLAAIMFTSGSTGVPRGVMVSHANIIANTRSIQRCWLISTRRESNDGGPAILVLFRHLFAPHPLASEWFSSSWTKLSTG